MSTITADVALQDGVVVTLRHGDLIVPWWSLTKLAIAAAALTLVRDGRADLDEPVAASGSLRALLGHRAGCRDYGALPAYHTAVAAGDAPWGTDDLLARVGPPEAEPSGWRYSNIGYLLVRRWMEARAGAPLGDVLAEHVFLPLGLLRPRVATEPSHLADVAMGTAAGYHPGWVYHGLVVGPLLDAALFVDRLFSGALLPPGLLAAMLDGYVVGGPMPGRPWTEPAYGLGVMMETRADGTLIAGHTGGGPGSAIAAYRTTAPGQMPVTRAAFAFGHAGDMVEHAAFGTDRSLAA